VIQSTSRFKGLHVAIIMDGNGRWATRRGLPRSAGHRAGIEAVRQVVREASGAGIGILTLYAFSADNWERPPAEVETLMTLFRRFLRREARACAENGARLNVIGRRDRLNPALQDAIAEAERETAGGARLLIRLAIDYSSRDGILAAAALRPSSSRTEFASALAVAAHSLEGIPDVDLLIRTGEERRLSDFLLWECAYAELYFTDTMWPDFAGADLVRAVVDFGGRQRRFGRIDPPAVQMVSTESCA
jgi:undecaprenyl diphosphate synthase